MAQTKLIPAEAVAPSSSDAAADPHEVINGGLSSIRLLSFGDVVIVRGEGSVRDQRPGAAVVWRFELLTHDEEGDPEPLLDSWYREGLVSLLPRRTTALTFQDSFWLPLPAGDYIGRLSLYSVLPGMDVAELAKDEAVADRHFIGAGSAPIRIGL